MRLRRLALMTAFMVCAALLNSAADASEAGIIQVGHCDCGEAVCGCEPVAACCDGCGEAVCGCEPVADCCDGCGEAVCGCEPVGCDSGCCDSSCGGGCLGGCFGKGLGGCLTGGCLTGGCPLSCCGDCCLDDPCSLFGEHCGYSAGGWVQMGYFNKANTLFNSRADELQLQQAWLWAEKSLDTSCGFDWGGRLDYLYGTDSQDTQAFGTDPRGWDNPWDNGPDYGHALPQVYLEAGYGDLSVKVGHFYTIIGWEVVGAPDNFFYSHAYTMYNSEPFTHTGALFTYALSDDVEVYGGYTLGWDSGFDDNGDSFLGGISLGVTDNLTLIYATVGGRFGEARFNGVEKGYMHSIVADLAVSDNLQWIFQTDLLDTVNGVDVPVRDTFDINNYLIYSVNDCWQFGVRGEWYQNEGVYTDVGQNCDIYELTLGVNYHPHANVIIRPEIRWDWVDGNTQVLAATNPSNSNTVTEDGSDDQTTFGIDTIITF